MLSRGKFILLKALEANKAKAHERHEEQTICDQPNEDFEVITAEDQSQMEMSEVIPFSEGEQAGPSAMIKLTKDDVELLYTNKDTSSDEDGDYELSGSEFEPDSDHGSDSSDHESDSSAAIVEKEVNVKLQGNITTNKKVGAEDGNTYTSRGTKKIKNFPENPKTSKVRARNPDEWKKNKAAIARQKGQKYITQKEKEIPAKSVNVGNLCNEKCRLKCSNMFDENARKNVLRDCYNLDLNAKNALLFRSIIPKPIARQRKNAKKPKSHSYKYVITLNNTEYNVCKIAFCSLFQIGRGKLQIIKDKLKSGTSAPCPDARGRHDNRPHKMDDSVTKCIMEHIAKFPSESSHYSRNSNPHKKYLSPTLNMTLMYRLYIEECNNEKKPAKFLIKKASYAKIFSTKFNLSFSHPKSDTCSTCDSGQASEEHHENIRSAYQLMKDDREKAFSDNNICYVTVDLQQTMPLPKLTTSKAFYLRQIWFYNLEIHLITTDGHKPVMQTWTEDVASKDSAAVASCLWNFAQICEEVKSRKHLVVWSDSCPGQNKNFSIVCLYQLMILKGLFNIIDHKFPEVGHTYLDSDRDFGRIEQSLRKQATIYSPQQYRDIIKKSTGKNSVVNDMEHHFRDIEKLQEQLGLLHRKKNLLNEKVPFRDGIKWIRVDEFGSYLYKESYDKNAPFKKVSLLRNSDKSIPCNVDLVRLKRKTGSISQEKVDNITVQLPYIEEEHRWLYEQFIPASPKAAEGKQKKRKTK